MSSSFEHFNVQKGVDKVKRAMTYMFLGVALVLMTASANATVLVPPSGPMPADLLGVGPFPGVTTLIASTGGAFTSLGGSVSGTYEAVVLSDPGNVFCAGCFDFEIQVVINTGSDAIGRITASNFAGFSTDVGYDPLFCGIFVCSAGTPVAPSTVDRTTADVIGFNFASGVTPGNGTEILEIETNATSYTSGYVGIIDSIPTAVAGFAPAVPEPGSMFLLGLGLLSLAGLRKKLHA